MSYESKTQYLRSLPGVQLFAPPRSVSRAGSPSLDEVLLPDDHLRLLLESNGVTAFGGYFRLFGLEQSTLWCISEWNELQTWKFAWKARADGYLIFGETAFGDQFAYRESDLRNRKPGPVLVLDAVRLESEEVSSTFEEFIEEEFLRNATAPYDDMIVAARARFGELGTSESLLYSPSLLLGGEEEPRNLMKAPSRTAMILNGDLASQVLDSTQGGLIQGVEPYEDDRGRSRVKVVRMAG